MNHRILSAGAALMLAACGGQPAPNEAAADTTNSAEAAPAATTSETAPAADTATATPAKGAAPTKEFMVGKWGESGECELALEFKADGSMVGPVDRWELNGAELTLVGLPQKMVLSVIDDKTMESRLDGTGEPRRLTRC
jgi:hypothetical protein